MNDLIGSVIRGFPYGCVYALLAVGLVLTYRAAGVFNLALGAQAFVSAAVYYDVRARHDWPILAAFFLAVVVVGPLLGLVLNHALFRHLRGAPPVARLVTSLGLLVAIPEIAKLWFGSGPAFAPPSISPYAEHVYRFGSYALDGNEVATIASTVAVVIALTAIFRLSPLGLRMRAVVESPRMAELAGINADRVSGVAWILSSLLAGLAGVLLAPLFAQVNATNFTTLLVAAIAAAAFGGLASIPLTFLGGVLLGVAQQVVAGYLPLNSVLAQGLRPSLPFAALFLLLLLRPGLRGSRELQDPLAGVDPPPPPPGVRGVHVTSTSRVIGVIAGASLVGIALFALDAYWLGLLTAAVAYGVIFLSITVVSGVAGQISLCQATFAGIGAFTTAQLVARYDVSVLVGMLLGAVLAAVVGALLALPAVRLGGIHLALATLAFALMFDSILVPLGWVGGGALPLRVPRPVLGPLDFENDRLFLVLCVGVLVVAAIAVVLVRVGRTGRFLDAVRTSEAAAMSVGIDTTRAKITAFACSAAIAGFGGGLLASQQHEANPSFFVPFFGLFWVVIVVVLGSRSVKGAVAAGLALMLLPEILHGLGFSPVWQYILFGVGAVTYARHPEGILEAWWRTVIRLFASRSVAPRAAPAAASDGERDTGTGDVGTHDARSEP